MCPEILPLLFLSVDVCHQLGCPLEKHKFNRLTFIQAILSWWRSESGQCCQVFFMKGLLQYNCATLLFLHMYFCFNFLFKKVKIFILFSLKYFIWVLLMDAICNPEKIFVKLLLNSEIYFDSKGTCTSWTCKLQLYWSGLASVLEDVWKRQSFVFLQTEALLRSMLSANERGTCCQPKFKIRFPSFPFSLSL